MAGILLNAHLDVVAVEGVLKCGASTHGDADSTLQHAGLLIDVQCKRPQSLGAFVARFKEAIDQIRADRRPKQQGIVAIDCSSAIRPDFGVLVRGDESEAYHDTQFHLRERLIPLLVTHLLPRVLGLILFARVPVRIEQVSPILASGGAPFTWIAPYTIRCVVGVVNAECLDPHLATSIFDSLPQSGHRVPTGG